MAKFQYRMQNILDVKLKIESQAKIAYGIANAKLEEEQMKLQKLIIRRAGYEQQAKELMMGNIDIQEVRNCRKAIDTMKSLIRTQMMQVHVAEKNLEAARKRLNDVMVERKTHEKLKEKAFETFKQELQYAENKEIDELVSYTYHGKENADESR
ncbi:flagellar export protein FliJ [Roseburia sp. 831b]|uniref:flagellar export protein FliJ n=1 Tax=Roseburia sp. 831b TaxID=1261635 RepID=UPI0009536503|nr:flagellar export protein FliJ [Roseburia sp. 831b]WVK73842.1 flagellar export protein FliJ [Roseburia sp. 831b]